MATENIRPDRQWPIQAPRFDVTDERIDIRNTLVEGQSLDVGARSGPDVIGWGARLFKCQIRLGRLAHTAIVLDAEFNGCRFSAKGKQRSVNWRNVVYEDCEFSGVFEYCSFGFRDALDPDRPAGLRRCNFSAARLDACGLGNANLSTLVLPESPHLIFIEPSMHREAIEAIVPDWPVQGFLQNVTLRDGEYSAGAYSRNYLEQKGFPPEQYSALLKGCRRLDFVRINF